MVLASTRALSRLPGLSAGVFVFATVVPLSSACVGAGVCVCACVCACVDLWCDRVGRWWWRRRREWRRCCYCWRRWCWRWCGGSGGGVGGWVGGFAKLGPSERLLRGAGAPPERSAAEAELPQEQPPPPPPHPRPSRTPRASVSRMGIENCRAFVGSC